MKSAVIKHSILLHGHKTSVSLETEFWDELHQIAGHDNMLVSTLVEQIDHDRENVNLSSAIRVFVFNRLRSRMDQRRS
jgi:predicted DNA-binding ribbon-helix-helix protein